MIAAGRELQVLDRGAIELRMTEDGRHPALANIIHIPETQSTDLLREGISCVPIYNRYDAMRCREVDRDVLTRVIVRIQ